MKKIYVTIISTLLILLTLSISTYGQDEYTVDKMEDLGEGFEAKYITNQKVGKSILVKFPEKYLVNDEMFNTAIHYSLVKLFGEKEFGDKVKNKITQGIGPLGIPMSIVESPNWRLTIRPIVNDFIEFKIVGIEIIPKKLGVDL